VYQLAQVGAVIATEKFAFQQRPYAGNVGAFCVDDDKTVMTFKAVTALLNRSHNVLLYVFYSNCASYLTSLPKY